MRKTPTRRLHDKLRRYVNKTDPDVLSDEEFYDYIDLMNLCLELAEIIEGAKRERLIAMSNGTTDTQGMQRIIV